MTHYDVNYSDLTPQAKHDKAIADIKDYLGDDKYRNLTAEFRAAGPMPLGRFEMYLSIAGVQGYPVRAWYNEVYPFG